MGQNWPMVGRATERDRVHALYGDGARGVVLAGSVGVGKTRLAQQCLEDIASRGHPTASAAATRSASGLPFGALASLLPSVDEHSGGAASLAGLLRRFHDALSRRGTDASRLALLVDDAHLLDDASATLVQQMATEGDVFVIATVRTGEPAPDPVVLLWKDRVVEWLELSALSAENIEELLSGALGGPIDRAASVKLAVRCEGNALFLRELVAGALDDGTLHNQDGIWLLTGPLRPSLRLVEIVGTRLSGLAAEERDFLEILAVGEPIGAAELAVLADPFLAEACERKGLVSSRFDGQRLEVRLGHPLYGEVLRSRIPALRARTITRALAEATEGTGARRRDDTLRIATWRLEGGGARPELMVDAATIARWRHDYPLAERLARAALAAGAGFDAALLCAQLAGLQGRGDEEDRELARLADEATDDVQRGLATISRLDQCFFLGRVEEGLRVAEEAEAAISDPAWRGEVAARRAAFLLATQSFQTAADAAEPFLDGGDDRTFAWASSVAEFCLGRLGQLDRACELARQGVAAHLALQSPIDWDPCVHTNGLCAAMGYRGDIEQAESLAIETYQAGVAAGNLDPQAFMCWHLGRMVREQGHIRRAIQAERQGATLFGRLGRPQQVHDCLTYLAMAQALTGDSRAASETLAELEALGLPRTLYTAVDLLEARAWTSVAAGDLPRARQLLQEAVSLADEATDRVGGAAALHALARLGSAAEVLDALTALAGKVDGVLIPAKAAHVAALVSGDAEELGRVAEEFRVMGANLLAAEASADAAVAWRKAGQPRRAAAAQRFASSVLPAAEGVVTPALQAIEGRARLTRAERDVALMAAAGRPSKQIAREMGLSVRTVENNLQRVYEKLGISGRAELGAVLSHMTEE